MTSFVRSMVFYKCYDNVPKVVPVCDAIPGAGWDDVI